MNQNKTKAPIRSAPRPHNVYSGYFPNNHNRLGSVDPLIQHSRSWRELQARSASEPEQRPGEWLDWLGFALTLAFILFIFIFLPELLGS